MRRLLPHAVVLWTVCPLLLLLASTRPFVETRGRAAGVPRVAGGFVAMVDYQLPDSTLALLGTDDVVQRRYERGDDVVFLVAVFHAANWKSVHPPHTCLRGSHMEIVGDDRLTVRFDDGGRQAEADIGRLVLTSLEDGRRYLSLFAYVAPPDLVTGNYWEFFGHHAPLALLRKGVGGCLLRVETWVGPEGDAIAERRCREFFEAMLPRIREMVR
ncbi:MAG: EpsI family protein [Planctomycetes bacterium]|nr:EpsI family protein [Planctomycetota bacterium]